MKVYELIKELHKYDQQSEILLSILLRDTYESGQDTDTLIENVFKYNEYVVLRGII